MSQKPSHSDTSIEPELSVTGRTLVLCFDGTSESYAPDNTNPVKLFALLKKDDWREQLCYYQPGIGTYVDPGMVSPVLEWGAKVLDQAFAIYLNDHVMDGYRFLMNNYHTGDKICLFGFSRGSYTARALAGMLHKVGLLPRDNQEQVPFAFKMYQKTSASGIQMAAGYKETFCQDVQVEFLGIWETVASVGIIMGRTLPETGMNSSVKTFRHAVSLDEHRVRFQPYLLEPKPDGKTDGKDYPSDTLEVWFSGCHGDVGGGNVANSVTHSLSDITLRWMVRQIMASDCGILFDNAALDRAGIPFLPHPSPVEVSPEERAADDVDSGEPLDDGLTGITAWELLEILPLTWSVQDVKGAWHRKFGFHLGRGRTVVDPNPKFHYTVKERMANTALKYRPKAHWVAGTEVYVE